MNQVPVTAALAAIAAVGVLLVWLALFLRPRVALATDFVAEPKKSFLQRLHQSYNDLDLPLKFNFFVVIAAASSALSIITGIIIGAIGVGLVIAAAVPFMIIAFLIAKRDAIRQQRREELALFIKDYADLLALHGSIQAVNLEMATGDSFFSRLFDKINRESIGEKRLVDVLSEARDYYNSGYWKEFMFLLANGEKYGARIKPALDKLSESLRSYALQIERIRARQYGDLQASYAGLVLYFVGVLIIRNIPDMGQFLDTPGGIIGQIISATIAVLAWYLFQVISRRGLYAEEDSRITFVRAELEAE